MFNDVMMLGNQELLVEKMVQSKNTRPDYADLDSPAKFQAIQGIILTRLKQHPKAICSYSVIYRR